MFYQNEISQCYAPFQLPYFQFFEFLTVHKPRHVVEIGWRYFAIRLNWFAWRNISRVWIIHRFGKAYSDTFPASADAFEPVWKEKMDQKQLCSPPVAEPDSGEGLKHQ